MADRIQNFEEFWPFYLREHALASTRWIHWLGTNAGLAVMLTGIATGRYWMIAMGFVTGYGFAWFSHFFIEKNKPASFSYPVWSFMADWKLWALIWTGQIKHHVAKYIDGAPETADAPAT